MKITRVRIPKQGIVRIVERKIPRKKRARHPTIGLHEPGEITIDEREHGKSELNTIVHECGHQVGLEDEHCYPLGDTVAEVLWRLGWRKVEVE